MEYFNNSQNKETMYQEDMNFQNNCDMERKIDRFTFQQIELFIQQQYQIHVPAIIFEYVSVSVGKDFMGWDYDDLFNFFGHFGEIQTLEIYGKISVVLFKTFFDANTAREFLQNGANFKDSERFNFHARWFKQDDEFLISDTLKTKMNKFTSIFMEMHNKSVNFHNNGYGYYNQNWNMNPDYNMKGKNINLNLNQNQNLNGVMNNQMNLQAIPNMQNMQGMPNIQSMSNMQNLNIPMQNINGLNNIQLNNLNQINGNNSFNNFPKQNGTNYNEVDERKSHQMQNGKYTCRFEIQIENDKEFQVARRLIGAKGCNMKKIVEICGKNVDGSITQDAVKLRLRGKGSGYKEGPFNKESDEPLHLCISSKFYDRYKMAINSVQELIQSVYEEYKKYCERTSKIPVQSLAIRKDEGISSRKNTLSKNDNDN